MVNTNPVVRSVGIYFAVNRHVWSEGSQNCTQDTNIDHCRPIELYYAPKSTGIEYSNQGYSLLKIGSEIQN